MSKAKIAFGIAAGVFFVYAVAAPYITVHRIKSAARNDDGEALSAHIEFISARQSLKDQMNVMFAKKMAEDEEMKDNPFAALGAAFAGVVVDKMVDAYVTPAGITQLMSGEKPQPRGERSGKDGNSAYREPLEDASMSYESLNKFVARIRNQEGGETRFVLTRRGLDWKLTEIIVPLG